MNHDVRAIVISVHRMKDVTRINLEPPSIATPPVAWHHAKTSAGITVELEGEPVCQFGKVKHNRQVHEDHIVLCDVEVVHHHHIRNINGIKLL